MTVSNIFAVVALVAAAMGVFAFIRQRQRLSFLRTAQSSLSRLPETRCFKCGAPMEDGFVVITRLTWRAFSSSPGKFTGAGERLKNICQDETVLIFNKGVPENRALRCRHCMLVTIDHSQLFVFEKK